MKSRERKSKEGKQAGKEEAELKQTVQKNRREHY